MSLKGQIKAFVASASWLERSDSFRDLASLNANSFNRDCRPDPLTQLCFVELHLHPPNSPFLHRWTFTLIAVPGVIESPELVFGDSPKRSRGDQLIAWLAHRLHSSRPVLDKANRSSGGSFRGTGVAAGLDVLAEVKRRLACACSPKSTQSVQAAPVAEVVGVLQIPPVFWPPERLLNRGR